MNRVKATLLLLATLFAAACEYDVPLSEKQGLPIDPLVLGLWEEVSDNAVKQKMTVSASSGSEYRVHMQNETDNTFMRGYPVRVAGIALIQLVVTDKNYVPKKGTGTYIVLSYTVSNGDLVVKLPNPELLSTKLKSSAALREAFIRNKNNPRLFPEPVRFRKINPNEKLADLDALLLSASQKGDVATVKALLAKGVNGNVKDNKGLSALMIAAYDGNVPIVQALLDKGAEVNAKKNDGDTALMGASIKGKLTVVRILLDNGANVDARNNDNHTALMLAAYVGQVPVVQALLAKGAEINAKNDNDRTALMLAAMKGQTAAVQALLARGADVYAIDKDGHTALDIAAVNNQTDIVQILKEEMNKPCPRPLSAEHLFRLNGRIQTGVVIKRGDRLTFSASGIVTLGIMAGSGGPDGINGFRGYNLVRGDIQHGALVAQINKAEGWYVIGRGKMIIAGVDGILELAVNDMDAGNNSGQFEVKVSICKAR